MINWFFVNPVCFSYPQTISNCFVDVLHAFLYLNTKQCLRVHHTTVLSWTLGNGSESVQRQFLLERRPGPHQTHHKRTWRHEIRRMRPKNAEDACRVHMAVQLQRGARTELPDWLFSSQKPEIWLFWEAVGSKIFIWLFGYFLALLQHFVPQIFLWEELRVVRVACPRNHKTRSGPTYSCVMLNEHPNIPKKR